MVKYTVTYDNYKLKFLLVCTKLVVSCQPSAILLSLMKDEVHSVACCLAFCIIAESLIILRILLNENFLYD